MAFHDVKDSSARGDARQSQELSPLVKRVRDDLKDWDDATKKWLDEQELCEQMYAGHQWPDDDAGKLDKEKKPRVTFNRSAPLIDVLVGAEVQNRRRMIFNPSDPHWNKGTGKADLATSSVVWALESAKASHYRSRVLRDMLVGGLGFESLYPDFSRNPDGLLKIDRCDPREMRWDPAARDFNLRDARWMARKRRWSRSEIKSTFGIDIDELAGDSDFVSDAVGSDADEAPKTIMQFHPDPWREGAQKVSPSSPSLARHERKSHWVTEYQYFEMKKYVRVLIPPPADSAEAQDDPMTMADEVAGGPKMVGSFARLGEPEPQPGGAPMDPAVGAPMAPPSSLSAMGPPTPPLGQALGQATAQPTMQPPPGMPSGPMPPPPPGGAPTPAPQGAPPMGAPPMGAPGPTEAPPAAPPGAPPAAAAPPPPPVPPAADLPEDEGDEHEDPDQWEMFSIPDYEKLVQRLKMMGEELPYAVQLERPMYRQVFVTGSKVLRDEEMWIDGFSYLALTGKWDNEDKCWYGIMRPLVDPQRAANKFLSAGIHQFNSSAKGALLVEAGAVVNSKTLPTEWSKPNAIITFRPDMLAQQRYQIVDPRPFPEAAASIMQWSVGAMREVTGINIEMTGMSEGDGAPGAMQKRQMQGMTVLAGVLDSLDVLREDEAWVALKIVKKFLSNKRMIRVAGAYEGQRKHVQLLRENFADDYDLQLDDTPRDPAERMKVFEILQPLFPIMFRDGPIPDPIKDIFPIQGSILQAWKKYDAEKASSSKPPPVKMSEDPNYIAAMTENIKADAELKRARAKALLNESAMGMVETAQDIQIEREEIQLKLRELDLRKRELGVKAADTGHSMKLAEDKGTLDALEVNHRLSSPGYPGE